MRFCVTAAQQEFRDFLVAEKSEPLLLDLYNEYVAFDAARTRK